MTPPLLSRPSERGYGWGMDPGELDKRFTYHAPKGDQQERYIKLRSEMRRLAAMIVQLTPESREQALALTKLEECSMWANASIARRE